MRPHLARLAGASLLLGGFGAALSASSCTNPATEIVPGFSTQIRVPDELKSVVVAITQGGRPISCRVYPVTDSSVSLPATLGILPAEDRDGVPPEPVIMNVLGYRTEVSADFEADCFLNPLPDANQADVMVVRRAALQYDPDRIVFMPMPLKESCADIACDDDKTCKGGICVDATVDSTTLPDYRDDLIFGDANTCFDPDVCMDGAVLAVMTDEETCTFQLPIPEDQQDAVPRNPGNLNVEVIYSSLGSEILDLDEEEGFVFPDESDPWTFRLADNLCTSQFKDADPDKIVAVYASPLCVAKRALQPICTDAIEGIQAGQRSPAAALAGAGELCPFGDPLEATASVLYVLMDRSASMGDFFGMGGLDFAVGISLENPVAKETRVALSWLPAADTECPNGPSYVNSPDFPFAAAEDQREPVATALGDTATLLPGAPADDPELYLDAALRGAYAAVDMDAPASYNRKAVVVVSNRDFQSHCGGDTLETIAADALANQDIYTYVAVLNGPTDAPNFGGPSPQAGASALATAGGTGVFDAVADETEGALAVQKVLNDLGSCKYEPPNLPNGPDGNAISADEITSLTFVDPTTSQATIVERDDACTTPEDAADGFGFTNNGQVVICGQPCQTLRDTLINTASYYAGAMLPAAAVPIIPGLSCTRKAELVQQIVNTPMP